jgi:hypothetical protein
MGGKPTTQAPTLLEQTIADALGNPNAALEDLVALIAECETGIERATAAAAEEKVKAMDPAMSPDPRAALDASQLAEFAAARLRTLLPRLHEALRQAQAREVYERWISSYQKLKPQLDEAAEEFAEEYPALVAKLVELFKKAAALDVQLSACNSIRPAGEPRHLRSVELTARDLADFSYAAPSILKLAVLPDFEHSDQNLWPLKAPSMASVVMPMDGRVNKFDCSPEWWRAGQEATEEKRKQDAQALAQAARERDEFYGRRTG